MRRTAALALAVLLTLGACSKPERPTLDRVAGTIEPSAAGDAPAGATDGTDPAATTPPAPGATDPGATTGDSTPVPAAADALTAYFDALQAEDFATAQRVSSGSARFMARIRDVVARYNAEREGVTELTYSSRSFSVESSDASRVVHIGSARLDSTVSGPAGDPYSESVLFENPVVSFESGSWQVSDYTYDGQPIEQYPATSSKKVGGVDLRLQGALAFGTSTGLIIDLVTDSDHDIKVDNAHLNYADGTSATPTLAALITRQPAALYFLFERSGSRPVTWTATVTIDAGTSDETTEDVALKF